MSATESQVQPGESTAPSGDSNRVLLIVTWLWVGLPFLFGVYKLITTASKLFVH